MKNEKECKPKKLGMVETMLEEAVKS